MISSEKLNSDQITVNLESNGIMQVVYPTHAFISTFDIRKEHTKRLALTKKKTPLLVKLNGLVSFSEGAQNLLCSKRNKNITSAAAIVRYEGSGYHEHSAVLIDLFKSFKTPQFDINIFDEEKEAVKWLKTYL